MKFKLDENLGRSIQAMLEDAGHEAPTVRDQTLRGSPDPVVLSAAQQEGRVLITMDHDFGNVLVYPPEETAGIAVINLPGRPSLSLLRSVLRTLIEELKKREIRGRLWIVEPGRIRIHELQEPTEPEESE
jgi:predicted nuclease of predicted toxin-antitoxin system